MILKSLIAASTLVAGFQENPCGRADALIATARAVADDALARRADLYREALALCPTHPEAQNNLGDTYERMARYDEALQAYRRAVELKPDWALPYFGFGDVYRKKGSPDEALYWYRRRLEFDADNADTLRAVRELTTADPAGLVDSRSIGRVLDVTRGPNALESIPFDEQRIPFEFDSATLRPSARAQIREIAFALWDRLGVTRSFTIDVSQGPVVAEIAGHADRRGTDAYNEALSRRRAQAVVDVLVSDFKIPRGRLRATGFGRARPVCSQDTEECYAQNRRVEIRRP